MTLQSCTGLASFNVSVAADETTVEKDSNGEFVVNMTTEIPQVGPVSCTGSACAYGSLCLIEWDPAVAVSPSLTASNIKIVTTSRLVEGEGDNAGKICLQQEVIKVESGEFIWDLGEVNLNGLTFTVPDDIISDAFDAIEKFVVTDQFKDSATDSLKELMAETASCFDIPAIPSSP